MNEGGYQILFAIYFCHRIATDSALYLSLCQCVVLSVSCVRSGGNKMESDRVAATSHRPRVLVSDTIQFIFSYARYL